MTFLLLKDSFESSDIIAANSLCLLTSTPAFLLRYPTADVRKPQTLSHWQELTLGRVDTNT